MSTSVVTSAAEAVVGAFLDLHRTSSPDQSEAPMVDAAPAGAER